MAREEATLGRLWIIFRPRRRGGRREYPERGEAGERQVPDARFAIAENGGGIYGIEESVCCITILARGQ